MLLVENDYSKSFILLLFNNFIIYVKLNNF